MLRKFALVITLTFGSFQAHAEGLDLNDALTRLRQKWWRVSDTYWDTCNRQFF